MSLETKPELDSGFLTVGAPVIVALEEVTEPAVDE